MSWFKRTKDPLVTDDYLRTTETVSRPMAIVYTIGMVFVVGALAFSIFFGARWLYENLDGSNQEPATVVTAPITATPPKGESTSSKQSSASSSAGGQSTSSSTSTSASTSNPSQSVPTSTTNKPTAQKPATTPEAIPATGPTETVVVFMIATVLGILVYQTYIRARIQ